MIAKFLMCRYANRLKAGSLKIEFPDNSFHSVQGTCPGPAGHIAVHSMTCIPKILIRGDLAIAETYIEGLWSSEDLSALIELVANNQHLPAPNKIFARVFNWFGHISHRKNANTVTGSRRNIAYHYDLGNDFYRAWLDSTMTYSSALFENGHEDMETAQNRKYRAIADSINLSPGDRVLEIGCGWGGFAEVAARDYGASVIALTLSREQASFARERMEKNNLSGQVEIRLQDYRQVEGEFDKIVSIEMFEAVGEENWPVFFRVVRDRLAPNGKASLQVITIDKDAFARYRNRMDFIQRYIFPGGMLPSPEALSDVVSRVGMHFTKIRFFGLSYAQTLRQWRERFLTAWPSIAPLGFDQRFKRMWFFYLCYCEGGFKAGRINVGQFVIHKPCS